MSLFNIAGNTFMRRLSERSLKNKKIKYTL